MDELAAAAEKAAKSAKRAVGLALVVLAIAAAVLAIDNSIKHAILDEAANARKILDEFKAVANGAQAAEQDRAAASGGVDGGDDVVHVAGAPAETPGDAGNGVPAASRRKGGTAGRSRGDG